MIAWMLVCLLARPVPISVDDLVATSTISDEELDAIVLGRGELPSLREIQQAALETWSRPEADWSSRARWRGLVPRIDLSAGSDADLDVRDGLDARTTVEGHAVGLRVTARFELGELVFADAELRSSKDLAARDAERRALLERVTALYFDRVAVLVAQRVSASTSLTLRARALDGQLRALTGGRLDRKDAP